MPELDNAIKKINNAANRADNTTNFYDNVVSGGKDDVYVNPNNNKSSKSVKGILDEAYQADKPDFTEFVDQCKAEVVNATDQASIATNQAAAAAQSASEASEISGLDDVASAVGLIIHYPDFLCTFNDSAELQAGFGARNTHGNKAVDFERLSEAEGFDKSGRSVIFPESDPRIGVNGISIYQSLTNTFTPDSMWLNNGDVSFQCDRVESPYQMTKVTIKDGSEKNYLYCYRIMPKLSAGDVRYLTVVYKKDLSIVKFGWIANCTPSFSVSNGLPVSGIDNTELLSFKEIGDYVFVKTKVTVQDESSALQLRCFLSTSSLDNEFTAGITDITENASSPYPYISTTNVAVTTAAENLKVTSIGNLPAPGKPFTVITKVDDLSATGEARSIISNIYNSTSYLGVDNYGKIISVLPNPDGGQNSLRSDSLISDKSGVVIMTYTGAGRKLYVNGVKVGQDDYINEYTGFNWSDLLIGRIGSSNYLNANSKYLKIVHRAYTDDDAKAEGVYHA